MALPTGVDGISGEPGFTNNVANITNCRVCGLSRNRTVVERCCSGNQVIDSDCQFYCTYTGTIEEWVACVSNGTDATDVRFDAFCLGGTASNNTGSLANSFACRQYAILKVSCVVLALLFSILFVGPGNATIVPSINKDLSKRQNNGNGNCAIELAANFTSSGSQRKVSPNFQCDGEISYTSSVPINTDLMMNNRTIHSTSAAETEYDAFFDVLSAATGGRLFPALSSVVTQFEFVSPRGRYFLT